MAIPSRADILYTYVYDSAPGVGTFGWTLDLPDYADGYYTPAPILDPINGNGCTIAGADLTPGSPITTEFSGCVPSTGGVLEPGDGAWYWMGINPDGYDNAVGLFVSGNPNPVDPPVSTPEPGSLWLLLIAMALGGIARGTVLVPRCVRERP